MILRVRLLPLLVLVMVLDVASLAAGPNFSLSATPSVVDTGAGEVATAMITVAPTGGFTSGVALSVRGVPAGVSAAFVPGTSAGTTVLWLTVSSAVRTSTTTLTVMGSGGGVTHTVGIYLSVAGFVSDFWIFANPARLTVARGSSGTSTIFTTAPTRFTDLPMFNASRLPAGVTASFGPTTASGPGTRATLSLTAASTAPTGGGAVIVTGRAGSVTATTRISLTVS